MPELTLIGTYTKPPSFKNGRYFVTNVEISASIFSMHPGHNHTSNNIMS